MSPSFVLVLTLLFFMSITIVDAYDYFLMAVQWPPAVCRSPDSPCKATPLPIFTIHGMWPGDSINGSRLYNCPGSPYDKNLFSEKLRRGLDNAWPNWKGVNSDVWEEEWTKHGRCSENNLNQVQYFAKAVEIWLTLDIDSTLYKGNVFQNTPYLLADIKKAINAATTKDPIVICKGGDKNSGRRREIEEIRVCMDKKYKFMQCPASAGADSGCAQQVEWITSGTDLGRPFQGSWLIVTCFLLVKILILI